MEYCVFKQNLSKFVHHSPMEELSELNMVQHFFLHIELNVDLL